MNKNFLKSINDKLIINVTFKTIKGVVSKRRCIPFDFGPSRRFRDRSQRYHFLVLEGPSGRHLLPLLPMQILKIELTERHFNPANYVKWKPKWFIKRNWGVYS
ncbi:MAG: hypothetical protein AB8B78_00055 [Polaribacter sp.]